MVSSRFLNDLDTFKNINLDTGRVSLTGKKLSFRQVEIHSSNLKLDFFNLKFKEKKIFQKTPKILPECINMISDGPRVLATGL